MKKSISTLVFFGFHLLFVPLVVLSNDLDTLPFEKINQPRIHALRDYLEKLKKDGKKVCMHGSKHSQGGHIKSKQPYVSLDLSPWNKIELVAPKILRVQAGAIWKDVLEFLNPLKLSVSIMQTDYDFSIGGSISTNVHGWAANKPPMVDSILGFHILLADGTITYCSREKNIDLFKAAIGGFGLLGIILDVDLEVVDNAVYQLKELIIRAHDIEKNFIKYVKNDPRARLFFCYFKVGEKDFLKDTIFRVLKEKKHHETSNSPFLYSSSYNSMILYFFALTQNNDFFKKARWIFESSFLSSYILNNISRNQILYHSSKRYSDPRINEKKGKIDLLQEYSVPIDQAARFIKFLQSMKRDLLNNLMSVTVRHMTFDETTVLKYAKSKDIFTFVMFFRGEDNSKFEETLKNIAQKITTKALELNGSYYLPHRGYQTKDQFRKAYPKWQEFLEIKHKYDPENVFINTFYENYLI